MGEGNPGVKNIELSNYGEIFLNPDIDKIIEYSFQKKIKLYASNGSNFNKISDRTLENLVKYRFHEIENNRGLLIDPGGTECCLTGEFQWGTQKIKSQINRIYSQIE